MVLQGLNCNTRESLNAQTDDHDNEYWMKNKYDITLELFKMENLSR